MHTIIVTASEMQKNFMKYIDEAQAGKEIIITQNGQEVGRFVPKDIVDFALADSLRGILEKTPALSEAKAGNPISNLDIENCDKILRYRADIMNAEASRLKGDPTYSVDDVRGILQEIYEKD